MGNFNVHLKMVHGNNGNLASFGQNLADNKGNQGNTGLDTEKSTNARESFPIADSIKSTCTRNISFDLIICHNGFVFEIYVW